jgi:hypothetical protein
MKTFILVFLLLTFGALASYAQISNSMPWPGNPSVGIGTQLSTPAGPQNALHIHHDSGVSVTKQAIIRLSEGSGTTVQTFGILGLLPRNTTTWSSLSQNFDLIMHEHQSGDLILTNWSHNNSGGAIRLATTGDTTKRPSSLAAAHDLERITILGNGNVGIDLPPDLLTGLGVPVDQLQIGGGQIASPGNTYPIPGLTIYGGNRFEGMPKPAPDTGFYRNDWRYISFNHFMDHSDATLNRSHRLQPMGSSQIGFAELDGGMLDIMCSPFDSVMSHDSAMQNFDGGVSLHLTGSGGLFFWSDERKHGGIQYHHLLDVFRPGVTPWPLTRNNNGLLIHHTPVLITSDSTSTPSIDFTHLSNVHPNIGDGDTWDLAVNGPALFKEAWVNTNDWPDYVFLPEYELRSIDEFEAYIRLNHHLPSISSASDMIGARPLGKTQEELTKQVEEMALYIVQMNKEIEQLAQEVKALKGGKQ